ncbi:hypothetical protein E2C01_039245 [Portunus trituberculatus]|uniref:Uncharacterized protein n=1 Tax=Portunus trituberculatus TaxID=210409 RepID=A0A5B7FK56_PORTR|nr:hypothetical protein [Portunus trituberculatus]
MNTGEYCPPEPPGTAGGTRNQPTLLFRSQLRPDTQKAHKVGKGRTEGACGEAGYPPPRHTAGSRIWPPDN